MQYAEERRLDQAVTEFKAMLSVARTRSLTGDVGTYPCGDYHGVKVTSDISLKNRYHTTLCCALNCGPPNYAISSHTLPRNTEFKDTFTATFLPFADGVDPAIDTNIEIKNTFINKCSFVRVSKIGVIDTGPVYPC